MGSRFRTSAAIAAIVATCALGSVTAARAAPPTQTPPIDRSAITSGCVRCHGDPAIEAIAVRHGLPPEDLYVPADALAGSVHRSLRCQSCHGTLSAAWGAHAEDRMATTLGSCAKCHRAQAAELSLGTHVDSEVPTASPLGATSLEGRRCVNCHGSHDIGPPMRPAGLSTPGLIPRSLPWIFVVGGAIAVAGALLFLRGRRGGRLWRRRPSLRAS